MKMKKITKQLLTLAMAVAVAAVPVSSAFATSSPSNSGSSSGSSSSSAAAAIAAASSSSTTATAQTDATVDSTSGDVTEANTHSDGTATTAAVENDSSVKISGTVTVNGVTYKVTAIGKGTFADADEVESVTINKNIKKFNSGAFTGATSLRTIKLNTTGKVTVNKNAFKGLKGQTITIKYSKKMSAANVKRLQAQFKAAAKQAGATVKFKKA